MKRLYILLSSPSPTAVHAISVEFEQDHGSAAGSVERITAYTLNSDAVLGRKVGDGGTE